MSPKIPLGERESQQLEFKSREALRHLPSIGREIVAMLNSGGGDLWIGLAEHRGRAVTIEGIENPQREAGRVRDHIVDSIEPSPVPGEFTVEEIPAGSGATVLRIRVRPEGRKPYSHREGTARHFLKRIDDRVRTMSREEIFGAADVDANVVSARQKLQAEKDLLQRKNVELLWVRIQPVGRVEVSPARDLAPFFQDHAVTGNRPSGWTFVNRYVQPKLGKGRVEHGDQNGPQTVVFADGGIEFKLPIEGLYWKLAGFQPRGGETTKDLWPYCLLEYPISVFRLASALYKERAKGKVSSVLGDVALFGLRGWTLRPYSPRAIDYAFRQSAPYAERDLVWDDPLEFDWEEILKKPDRCGFRLVARVYEAFGYYEDEIPMEFERESGRLRFPQE